MILGTEQVVDDVFIVILSMTFMVDQQCSGFINITVYIHTVYTLPPSSSVCLPQLLSTELSGNKDYLRPSRKQFSGRSLDICTYIMMAISNIVSMHSTVELTCTVNSV